MVDKVDKFATEKGARRSFPKQENSEGWERNTPLFFFLICKETLLGFHKQISSIMQNRKFTDRGGMAAPRRMQFLGQIFCSGGLLFI